MLTFELHACMTPRAAEKFGIPTFVLLKILHKLVLSSAMALDHLAPLYTPAGNVSTGLARIEGSILGTLAETNRGLREDLGSVLDHVDEGVERRQIVAEMKRRIIDLVVNERASIAKQD